MVHDTLCRKLAWLEPAETGRSASAHRNFALGLCVDDARLREHMTFGSAVSWILISAAFAHSILPALRTAIGGPTFEMTTMSGTRMSVSGSLYLETTTKMSTNASSCPQHHEHTANMRTHMCFCQAPKCAMQHTSQCRCPWTGSAQRRSRQPWPVAPPPPAEYAPESALS